MTLETAVFWSERAPYMLFVIGGFFIAFRGYRFIRFWLGFSGCLIGVFLGFLLGRTGLQDPRLTMIVTLTAGAVFAVLCAATVRIGALLVGSAILTVLTSLAVGVSPLLPNVQNALVLLAALLGALLGMLRIRVFLLAASSLCGGLLIVDGILNLIIGRSFFEWIDVHLELDPASQLLLVAGSAALGLLGLVFQMVMDHRRQWRLAAQEQDSVTLVDVNTLPAAPDDTEPAEDVGAAVVPAELAETSAPPTKPAETAESADMASATAIVDPQAADTNAVPDSDPTEAVDVPPQQQPSERPYDEPVTDMVNEQNVRQRPPDEPETDVVSEQNVRQRPPDEPETDVASKQNVCQRPPDEPESAAPTGQTI